MERKCLFVRSKITLEDTIHVLEHEERWNLMISCHLLGRTIFVPRQTPLEYVPVGV